MPMLSEIEFANDCVIGVFDSGVGGFSVLRELKKSLPSASFVYYADTAHCPYGEKSPEYVLDRARTITDCKAVGRRKDFSAFRLL